jgi:hypothetical protein
MSSDSDDGDKGPSIKYNKTAKVDDNAKVRHQ